MAFGNATFSDAAGAVGDLFAAQGDKAKADFDFAESKEYGLASDLATQNEKFTEVSTSIKEAQQQRELLSKQGGVEASVAGAGFAESGSAIDILRDSAAQGALAHAVLGQQGLIQEAGYKEQAQSYQLMSGAANEAGNAENQAAEGAEITAGIKGAASIATLFT